MKTAQFEEKEYEHALAAELAHASILWAPGQVLEQYLGFDFGVFTAHEYLWNIHGFPQHHPGLSPFGDLPSLMRLRPSERDRLPSFDLNCFIQAKRPSVGRRLPRRLAGNGLGKPFFVFATEREQQSCLESAAMHLSDRALFAYAAPVFGTSAELFGYMSTGGVVEHSTFPLATALTGHGAWYYSQPGAVGVRNPDFSRVEGPPLFAAIAALRERRAISRDESQIQSVNLKTLANLLFDSIQDSAGLQQTPRVAYLSQEWRRIEFAGRESGAPPAITSYLQVQTLARFFNLRWLVVDDRDKK